LNSNVEINTNLHTAVNDWKILTSNWKLKLLTVNEHLVNDDKLETYNLVSTLSESLLGGETVVTDSGSLYYITGQAFHSKLNRRIIISGALGAVGYALTAAIGIAVENKQRMTICLTGDGSMQINVQELATIAYYSPNIKIIVINNGGYASIRNTQTVFCNGNIAATDQSNGVSMPNWKNICRAYKISYTACDSDSLLKSTLQLLFANSGPGFLECYVPPNVEMFPAVTSQKLNNGTFISSKLHEMSPLLTPEQLKNLKI